MPPKKVASAKNEQVKKVRHVAKQLNEQELVRELNVAISNDVQLSRERSRSPSISEDVSRSPSYASENSPRLMVKRRRIRSPTNSPCSSRSFTSRNSSPRVPSPSPETTQAGPSRQTKTQPLPAERSNPAPDKTNRARRYELRLTSISEREILPHKAMNNQRQSSGGVRNASKRAGQIADSQGLEDPKRVLHNVSGQVPKDNRAHRSHGHTTSIQTNREDVAPKSIPQSVLGKAQHDEQHEKPNGHSISKIVKHAGKQPSQNASGKDKTKESGKGRKRNDRDTSGQVIDERHARKQTGQSSSGKDQHQEERDGFVAFIQVSPEDQDSRRVQASGRNRHARDTLGQDNPDDLEGFEQETDHNESIHNEGTSTSSVTVPADKTASRLENENRRLKETVKRLERKISIIETEKLDAINHALKLSIELQGLREGGDDGPALEFTEVDDIPATTEDMERLSARSTSDGMFVGLLLVLIIGTKRLIKMSATGQPSRRFAKMTNSDGSLVYPATEAVKPYIINFLCDKVAERNQKLLGYRNISKIRHASTESKIKAYITTKIGNLKKAELTRKNDRRHADVTTD